MSCTPAVRQCAIKIAAPAFGPCPEAAHTDLVEKREPRGDVEVEEGSGGWLTAKPQSEKDIITCRRCDQNLHRGNGCMEASRSPKERRHFDNECRSAAELLDFAGGV